MNFGIRLLRGICGIPPLARMSQRGDFQVLVLLVKSVVLQDLMKFADIFAV